MNKEQKKELSAIVNQLGAIADRIFTIIKENEDHPLMDAITEINNAKEVIDDQI